MAIRNKAVVADLAILFAALLWGADYIVAKRALEVIPPGYMNGIRFSICALILFVFVGRKLLKTSPRDIISGILAGVMMFGGFTGQTLGLMHSSVGNNAFITSAYVILVPFIAWALTRTRPGFNNFIAVFLTTVGVAMLTLQQQVSVSTGDLYTLSGAVFFAFEIALLGVFAKRMDPFVLAFFEAAVTGILSFAYAVAVEPVPAVPDGTLLLQLAYITFLGSAVTHITVTVALKYTSSSRGAVLCATESVYAVILAALFLGELLNLRSMTGSILIFSAVLVTELGERWFSPTVSGEPSAPAPSTVPIETVPQESKTT